MTDERATDPSDDDRPQPGPGDGSGDADGGGDAPDYGEDDSQDYVDRSVIDFDPADGLYTGTAVDGDSDIPGPSEGDIRAAQEEIGDDAQGNNSGEKAAAEKYIDENDVDLEQAQQGEAIAGSAQGAKRADDEPSE